MVQSLDPHVQLLPFRDWPLVAVHALNEVITMVSSVKAPLFANVLIGVGVGENSGRATSSNQTISTKDPPPRTGPINHSWYAEDQYKKFDPN